MSEEEKLNRITEIADQRTTTESDLSEIAELLISLIPVVGSTISGVEAIIATKIAIKAFEDGDFEAAEKAVIDVMTSSVGLIPGGKILARGGRSLIRGTAKEILDKIRQGRPSRIISRNLSKEDVAKQLKINRDSPSLDLLMQHREGTVRDFISKTRAGKINEVFPSEFLDMNLIDAIVKDNKRVRKLLRNRRFEK